MKTKRLKLTPNMVRWLTDLAEGEDPYARLNGGSEHGGACKVIHGLYRREFVEGLYPGKITAAGRAAIGKHAGAA